MKLFATTAWHQKTGSYVFDLMALITQVHYTAFSEDENRSNEPNCLTKIGDYYTYLSRRSGSLLRHFDSPNVRVGYHTTTLRRWCLGVVQLRVNRRMNSSCRACGHPLQDFNRLLYCPVSELYEKLFFGSFLLAFDLWSRPWNVVRLFFLHAPIPCMSSSSITVII